MAIAQCPRVTQQAITAIQHSPWVSKTLLPPRLKESTSISCPTRTTTSAGSALLLRECQRSIRFTLIAAHIEWSPHSPLSYFNTSVTHILTTVTLALTANPSRRFIWSEIKVLQISFCSSFAPLPAPPPPQWLEMWWPLQSASTQAAFKKLVANGQLEFVGAGTSPAHLHSLFSHLHSLPSHLHTVFLP